MSDVIIREKAEYHARTSEKMDRHLAFPPWSLRQKIVLTCRILAAEGHESALAGQITARADRAGFGLGFEEARASNIVLVHDDSQLLEGNGIRERRAIRRMGVHDCIHVGPVAVNPEMETVRRIHHWWASR